MKSLLAAATLITVAACAAPEAGTERAERGEYRTGSNIPRKTRDGVDRVEVVRPEDLERGRAGEAGLPVSR